MDEHAAAKNCYLQTGRDQHVMVQCTQHILYTSKLPTQWRKLFSRSILSKESPWACPLYLLAKCASIRNIIDDKKSGSPVFRILSAMHLSHFSPSSSSLGTALEPVSLISDRQRRKHKGQSTDSIACLYQCYWLPVGVANNYRRPATCIYYWLACHGFQMFAVRRTACPTLYQHSNSALACVSFVV